MKYEDFKRSNMGFGAYQNPARHEEEMLMCYAIANHVTDEYRNTYGHIDGPRIGDIVEFCDGYKVYKHAKIVEQMYGGSNHGMLCVCENGTSFTNGRYFSTSGGAFRNIHKSKMQLVGEDENMVWTWGCYGSGADQGIYFTLPVRKWIVPYEQPQRRSKVTIYGRGKRRNGRDLPAVAIENFGGGFGRAESFRSINAFKAWADYVGYRYNDDRQGTFVKVSSQRVDSKCYTDKAWQPPMGAKPIKIIRNGELKDAWVVTSETCITYYWPNIYDPANPRPRYGSPEYEREYRERCKYDGNPMGVE